MKKLVIAVAGTEGQREFKDVAILPGTKPRDILAKLTLNGFQLTNPKGGAFEHNEDLYPQVADGQKLYAARADVTAGFTIQESPSWR